MELTTEQIQAIRNEEYLRDTIRKELAAPKTAPGWLERTSNFFDTKVGFWLLTTVLAGGAAGIFTGFDHWVHRVQIQERETAQQSLRDTETVLKLSPMLTSEKSGQRDIAVVLLNGLTRGKGIDDQVAQQVMAIFSNTLAAGTSASATPDQKAQAASIIAYADRARIQEIQAPAVAGAPAVAEAPAVVPSAIDNSALPVRVYVQVAKEDRPLGETARKAMDAAGLIAPGVEVIAPGRSPSRNELRYCVGKADANAIDRVVASLATAVTPAPKVTVLAPSWCGKVRHNHFELWLAPRSPA